MVCLNKAANYLIMDACCVPIQKTCNTKPDLMSSRNSSTDICLSEHKDDVRNGKMCHISNLCN